MSGQFARFLLCGGVAATANWASRFGWSGVLPFAAAVGAAHATGMIVAFLLFRRFVFGRAGSPPAFVLVNLASVAVTIAGAALLLRVLEPVAGRGSGEALAHGLAIALTAGTSWIGHRRLTFAAPAPCPSPVPAAVRPGS